ncbi:hypothetical protein [Halorarius halobius]|uniref:hypothetical protein n=1 Tax=Halorarius halobius TaxID=2962671 RepID=UPI0020CCC138|nr:hypothetical protein [Halorarius halobius]
MDSASPIATRTAGQPTADSGTTVTFAIRAFNKAEGFALDWLGTVARHEHRGAHHPSATGYRQRP